MRSLMYFAVFTASLMRRFCFLLLAFLFPLQLFAGVLEPVAKDFSVPPAIVCAIDVAALHSAAASDGDSGASSDSAQLQADLEDQTLPASLATLPLDWQSFPHLYPHVNDGSSAFIDLQRPPPLV